MQSTLNAFKMVEIRFFISKSLFMLVNRVIESLSLVCANETSLPLISSSISNWSICTVNTIESLLRGVLLLPLRWGLWTCIIKGNSLHLWIWVLLLVLVQRISIQRLRVCRLERRRKDSWHEAKLNRRLWIRLASHCHCLFSYQSLCKVSNCYQLSERDWQINKIETVFRCKQIIISAWTEQRRSNKS